LTRLAAGAIATDVKTIFETATFIGVDTGEYGCGLMSAA
jgi:hypothetical protein